MSKRINAKAKGSRAERAFAEWLRERGCVSARRTQQYSGTEGTSDITATELSNWHIEHKATKDGNIPPNKLAKWLEQIATDCPSSMQRARVIINTPNRHEPVAFMDMESHFRCQEAGCFAEAKLAMVQSCMGLGEADNFRLKLDRLSEQSFLYELFSGTQTLRLINVVAGRAVSPTNGHVFICMDAKDWLQVALMYEHFMALRKQAMQNDKALN